MSIETDSAVIIGKVAYGVTIGDNKFGNSRPGIVEATLKPGKTLEDALDELDDRLNAWHRKKYPHLYQESKPEPMYTVAGRPPIVHEPVQEINLQHDRVKILIENAESLWELHDIKEHHPVMPVPVLEFYKKRLKEFEEPTP